MIPTAAGAHGRVGVVYGQLPSPSDNGNAALTVFPSAVYLVLLGPVDDVIDDEPLTHGILCGGIIAASRVAHLPVLHATMVVAWDNFVQDTVPAVLGGVWGMIVAIRSRPECGLGGDKGPEEEILPANTLACTAVVTCHAVRP